MQSELAHRITQNPERGSHMQNRAEWAWRQDHTEPRERATHARVALHNID